MILNEIFATETQSHRDTHTVLLNKYGRFFTATAAIVMLMLFPISCFAAEQPDIVCIQCHSKLPQKYSDPVKLWQGSIHAENGIACNSCHGGDPKDAANAMSPARGFLGAPKEAAIPAFCGRCHVGVMKDYLQSKHGKALGKGGPTCVTCHSNHLVAKASLDLISEKNCTTCHSFERASKIKNAMQSTESKILSVDQRINSYKQNGGDFERLEKALFAVRNDFHTLFHDLDADRVIKETVRINAELNKLDHTLNQMDEEQQKRKIVGAVAVLVALFAALLFHLLKKTFKDDMQGD